MPLRGSPNRSLGKLIGLFNSRNIGPDGVNGDTDQRLAEIPGYIQATGGSTVDSPTHRYHVFTASGSLVVTDLSGQPTVPSSMEYVVVAGGAGAGGNGGGGGGAGGVLHHPGLTAVAQTYTVVVGEGGNSNATGGDSYFGPTANSPTGPQPAAGGSLSKGGGSSGFRTAGESGGSGGGAGWGGPPQSRPGGEGIQPTQPSDSKGGATPYGNDGGYGVDPGPGDNQSSGGGGGAGGAGQNYGPNKAAGGSGQPFSNFPAPVLAPAVPTGPAWSPIVGPTGLFAGGGGGGMGGSSPNPGNSSRSPGGGGQGGKGNPDSLPNADKDAIQFTGSGGGGGGSATPSSDYSGVGADGIVMIRYPIT